MARHSARVFNQKILIVYVAVTCLLAAGAGELTIMNPQPTNSYHKDQSVYASGYGHGVQFEKAWFSDEVIVGGVAVYNREGDGYVNNFWMGMMPLWDCYMSADDLDINTPTDYWSVSTVGPFGTIPDHYACVDDGEGSGDILGAHVVTNTLEP
jgi:hypothetical protein